MFKGEKKSYKIIGICMACIQRDYVKAIAMSICREANKRGYRVFFFNTFNDMYYDTMFSRGETSIFKLINFEMLDALIVLAESIKSDTVWKKIVSEAQKAGIPVICVDKAAEECPSIVFKYTETFEKIVRHIVEYHGCRKVNFMAGFEGNAFSEERIECYKKVLAENNIEFEPQRLTYGDFWEIPTRNAMENFLASGYSMPEAIICCNDVMAIEVCNVLKNHGYKVPEDVLVTGFDGIDLEKYVSPRLATASCDIGVLGSEALDMLEKLMAGEDVAHTVGIPFKMRVSESCGCTKAAPDWGAVKIMELYNTMLNANGHEDYMFSYVFNSVDCMNFDEIAKTMFEYSEHHSWCCLNAEVINDVRPAKRYHEIFSEEMVTILRREDDDCQTNLVYPASQMLPDMEYALEKHPALMFVPLHFQEEIMGYEVVGINAEEFNFSITHRFINNTNQIFENLKNRMRLRRAYEEMAEMHMRDSMTGMYNRRGFYIKAPDFIDKYNGEREFVLISADLDLLKMINDTYGHDMGDKAIKTASDCLCRICGEESVCARFGGDEFVLLTVADNAENYISEFGQRLDKFLEDINEDSEYPFEISISCGCAKVENSYFQRLDDIIKLADVEMYENKRRRHRERR